MCTKFVNFLTNFGIFCRFGKQNWTNRQKNAEIWLKIKGFCAIFVENFQINKYHIITFYDKIVG